MKDWLIAGPILLYTLWVIIRQIRGKGKSACCGSARHSIYGIPDDPETVSCASCPARGSCGKRKG